jgi:NCS1 family nucleobase:cation symporter-1
MALSRLSGDREHSYSASRPLTCWDTTPLFTTLTTHNKEVEVMRSDLSPEQTGVVSRVEARSIDYVPASERSGRLSDQATIWFAGSAQLLSLATGAIGISLGLNLGWTLIALAIGTLLGTIPVSAHATQGPHLGLPQMVQSRPQFGRYGALFIWAMAVIVYWGYIVIGGNLLGETASELAGGTSQVWAVAICAVAILLAVFGYHWLHAAQRVITWLLAIVIVVYVAGLAFDGSIPAGLFDLTESFDIASFLIVVSAATGYQLTWAFFVSDYSRYMPANTSRPAIIAVTTGGLFSGLFTFMGVGAVCAALLPEASMVEGLISTGGAVFPGLGQLMLIAGGLGLLGLMAMCAYGGSLTLITALDSLRNLQPTRTLRVLTILVIGVTGAVAAVLLPSDFLNTSFSTVLTLVGYFMAPWTSVNLTDFFLVRRGRYSVSEMFRRDGVYGLWNLRGIASYLVTLLIMMPFMVVGDFEGPIATLLGGVDIAFFIGIPVGCVIYWSLYRKVDLSSEMRVVAGADAEIDEYAAPIE